MVCVVFVLYLLLWHVISSGITKIFWLQSSGVSNKLAVRDDVCSVDQLLVMVHVSDVTVTFPLTVRSMTSGSVPAEGGVSLRRDWRAGRWRQRALKGRSLSQRASVRALRQPHPRHQGLGEPPSSPRLSSPPSPPSAPSCPALRRTTGRARASGGNSSGTRGRTSCWAGPPPAGVSIMESARVSADRFRVFTVSVHAHIWLLITDSVITRIDPANGPFISHTLIIDYSSRGQPVNR